MIVILSTFFSTWLVAKHHLYTLAFGIIIISTIFTRRIVFYIDPIQLICINSNPVKSAHRHILMGFTNHANIAQFVCIMTVGALQPQMAIIGACIVAIHNIYLSAISVAIRRFPIATRLVGGLAGFVEYAIIYACFHPKITIRITESIANNAINYIIICILLLITTYFTAVYAIKYMILNNRILEGKISQQNWFK